MAPSPAADVINLQGARALRFFPKAGMTIETVDDRIIINRALARIGAPPIAALDDDDDLTRQAVSVYYDRRDTLLALHTWSFNKKTFKLDALAPLTSNGYDQDAKKFENGWRYAYAMPGQRLTATPRKVLRNPRMPDFPERNFAIEEGRLYADATPLWAMFGVAVPPDAWPATFRVAAIVLVAADLCVPVTHDSNLAQLLHEEGEGGKGEGGRGGLIGKAIADDIKGNPPGAPLLARDPLTDARWM